MVNTDIKKAKIGDEILIHYSEKLNDGRMIRTSRKREEPEMYKLGNHDFIRPVEVEIVGMAEGEKKSFTIPAQKAYGNYEKQLVFEANMSNFKNEKPKINNHYRVKLKEDKYLKVRVIDIRGGKVTLDGNHLLAGKDINYDIELVKIIKK
ncbi:FKBP-type peptidyl-prolyl cis-trans isomerase [candidate division KSB1 bacterium]|nr:FKBP-type peptidyl-prolyl cis-trans isomerase [candidate division KSB1 bacterium]MBL7095226.1 FKBP-type peptidyl-prolyl cis-trans isomerase [candidate division KSB1 bacterium]